MAMYKAVPGSTVLGASVRSTVEALELYKDEGYKLLAEAGIQDLKDDQWYDQQLYCNFLQTLKDKVGSSTLFVAGRNIGLKGQLPPQLNSPAKVLASFDQVYKMNHKGCPVDQGWKYTQTGENSAVMECNSPYPDELVRGVADGFVRRFKTGAIVVKIDETKPRMDNGGKSVTLIVNW